MPLLGPMRKELIEILFESFPTHNKLRRFVLEHLSSPVHYEGQGLNVPDTISQLIDELDSEGLFDSFLKEVQNEFQADVPQRSARIAQILRAYYAGPPPSRSVRLARRLNTREGVYAILSGLAALGVLHPSFKKLLDRIVNSPSPGLPDQLFYAFSFLLGLLTAGMVWKVWRRRSQLLRPEKFIIQPEDPHCFIGREREVADLWHECNQRSLVLLLGESGSGKSTLARFGLMSKFRPVTGANPRWHSIMIDGSTIAKWDGGIAAELARQLLDMSSDVRENLGAARPPLSDDVFAWIESWSKTAATRLLITFDQLDDYFESHRTRLMHGSRLLSPEELLASNTDWQRLARLVQNERIHLLLICRSDSLAHVVFRFATSSDIPLSRIDSGLVTPLLSTITEADEVGDVIENPDAGWDRLSIRLLDDLGRGGGVLPVQLVITLDALRRLPWLDLSEYAATGGLSGLSRRYIDGRIAEASPLGGTNSSDLLRGLVALSTKDGSKTIPLNPDDFKAVVAGPNPVDPRLDAAVTSLCRSRILRKRESIDGQVLQLYHDYLARPIRETYRLANATTELLDNRTQEFQQAHGVVAKLRATLSIREQLKIAWARLRGRLIYGRAAPYAIYSSVKSLTYGVMTSLAIAISVTLAFRSFYLTEFDKLIQRNSEFAKEELGKAWDEVDLKDAKTLRSQLARFSFWESIATEKYGIAEEGFRDSEKERRRKQIDEAARDFVSRIGKLDKLTPSQMESIHSLSVASTEVRLRAFEVGISSEHIGKVIDELPMFLHTTLGLCDNPNPFARAIVKRMEIENDSDIIIIFGNSLSGLIPKLVGIDVQLAAAAIVKRMECENNSLRLFWLGNSLSRLMAKLETKDVQPGAVAILRRMEIEENPEMISQLGISLGGLIAKLETKDVQRGAAAIVKRMEVEDNLKMLSKLGDSLSGLIAKLDTKDVRAGAVAIVKRMEVETNWVGVTTLGSSLDGLIAKLKSKDVQPAAAAIVKRMESEDSPFIITRLGNSLAYLIPILEPKDVQPLAAAIVKRMEIEEDSSMLYRLGNSLNGLIAKLEVKDVQPGALAIVKRMESEFYPTMISKLGDSVNGMIERLEANDAKSLAAAIVKQMQFENDSKMLTKLGDSVNDLIANLGANDAKSLAPAIVKRMESENTLHAISMLSKSLNILIAKLEAKDVQSAADSIVKRMEIEKDSQMLSELGNSLSGLIAKLDAKAVQPAADAIEKRMEIEKDSQMLSKLGISLSGLIAKLETKDVQPAANAIVKRMESEKSRYAINTLSKSLNTLVAKLEPEDVQPAAAVIVKFMDVENDSLSISILGDSFNGLIAKLEVKDVQPAADAIVKRMEIEKDSQMLYQLGISLSGLIAKLETKDVQPAANAIVKRMESEDSPPTITDLGNLLTSLIAILEPRDVQPLAAAIVKRMEIEEDSHMIVTLGDSMKGLIAKLEAKDVQQAANAIVKRMEIEKSSYEVTELGNSLKGLITKLEAKDVQPAITVIEKRIAVVTNSNELSNLCKLPLKLSVKLGPKEQRTLFDLLKHPQIVDEPRDILLKGFDDAGLFDEELYEGVEKDLDIWKFVDWANDPKRGGKYDINLQRSLREEISQ